MSRKIVISTSVVSFDLVRAVESRGRLAPLTPALISRASLVPISPHASLLLKDKKDDWRRVKKKHTVRFLSWWSHSWERDAWISVCINAVFDIDSCKWLSYSFAICRRSSQDLPLQRYNKSACVMSLGLRPTRWPSWITDGSLAMMVVAPLPNAVSE